MNTLLALQLGVYVTLGGALFALVLGILNWPGAAPAPVGARRRLRARSLGRSALLRGVDPVVRWLAARIDPLLPASARQRLDGALLRSGDTLGYVPAELAGSVLLAAMGGAGLGAGVAAITGHGAAYAAVSALIAGLLPVLSVREATKTRRSVVSRELPAAIDGLALAVSAGLDFPGALRQVIDAPQGTASPLIDELTTVLDQLALGQTRREALLGFADRVPVAGVVELVQSIVQAEEKGNPVIEVLLVQAQESRMKRSARAEEAASRAGVAMTLPLFLMFGCTMLVVLGPILLNVPRSLGNP